MIGLYPVDPGDPWKDLEELNNWIRSSFRDCSGCSMQDGASVKGQTEGEETSEVAFTDPWRDEGQPKAVADS